MDAAAKAYIDWRDRHRRATRGAAGLREPDVRRRRRDRARAHAGAGQAARAGERRVPRRRHVVQLLRRTSRSRRKSSRTTRTRTRRSSAGRSASSRRSRRGTSRWSSRRGRSRRRCCAGNTIVLKPSPYTPLATLKMVELLQQALPPGVLNVVSGGDELGKWMTSHPMPRKVSPSPVRCRPASTSPRRPRPTSSASRSSSVATTPRSSSTTSNADGGRRQALRRRVRATPGRSARRSSACTSPRRCRTTIVERHRREGERREVRRRDATRASSSGPINNKPQFERVKELVSEAIDKGATGRGRRRSDGRSGLLLQADGAARTSARACASWTRSSSVRRCRS